MLVSIYCVHNGSKSLISEFTVTMNQIIRDNQPMIMYVSEPENLVIKSDDYCLDYFWKPMFVNFVVPYKHKDVDFENRAWFGGTIKQKEGDKIVYGDYVSMMVGVS